ncbi:Flp family type IVb pilin [Nioella aestuarii]|uniref:Flp family type IVb pilin n=1 Tax=Nioella aestuarii TaxID=1662864 RepID=UPI003D7F46C6
MTCLQRFWTDESGSATAEWVVMTAASVAMGMAVMSYVSEGVESLSNEVSSALSGFEIMTSFDQWDEFRAQQAAAAQTSEAPSE